MTRSGRWVRVGAVAVLGASTILASRIGADGSPGDGSIPTATPAASTASSSASSSAASTAVARLNPLTPLDPTRIPASESAAIVRLGRAASPEAPGDGHGHSHAPTSTVPLGPDDASLLEAQLAVARDAALAVGTVEAAEAAGYRTAAVPGVGVGTHLVKWSLIDRPFDPAQPSMLLFDFPTGREPRIVGLSYWIRSDGLPEGFAGPNDAWHQHTGLCVVNGWIDRENSDPPPACPGTWFAGADLWMLHVWVVPGWENRSGVFANLNKKLCPPAVGTPDIARCSFFEGG